MKLFINYFLFLDNFMKYLFVISFVIVIYACENKNKDENRIAIARVNNAYLYKDEIADIVSKGTLAKDSILIVKKFIENWIREAVVLQKAEENLDKEQKNVEKQLEAYRKSLITYAYEKELVKQKLDTVVTNQEIEMYYNNNQKDFELKDNIIKVRYVKVNRKAPKLERLKALYKSDTPKDIEQLADYCHQFAENFYLDNESWLLFDDLLKEVPIQTYNKELFLQNNRFVEVSDSTFHYFLNIKGFKIKNSLSPLAFEKENIKSIILNKRKIDLINAMKQDLYNEALNNKNIEIYNGKNE